LDAPLRSLMALVQGCRRGARVLGSAALRSRALPAFGGPATPARSRSVSAVFLADHEDFQAGEERRVASGYMRNYLYPKGIAVYATEENVTKHKSVFDTEVLPEDKASSKKLNRLVAKLHSNPVEIRRNTKDGVTTFPGEVTAENISHALAKHRTVSIDPGVISLVQGTFPVKAIGAHLVQCTIKIGDEEHEIEFPVNVVKR